MPCSWVSLFLPPSWPEADPSVWWRSKAFSVSPHGWRDWCWDVVMVCCLEGRLAQSDCILANLISSSRASTRLAYAGFYLWKIKSPVPRTSWNLALRMSCWRYSVPRSEISGSSTRLLPVLIREQNNEHSLSHQMLYVSHAGSKN